MDTIRNVLVQLGDPLAFELLGDGLDSATDAQGTLLTTKTTSVQRCALTRPLSGSWIARVDVVATPAGATSFRFGVLPVSPRETLAQRRPVNTARPQDWNLTTVGREAIVVDRGGNVWRSGSLVGAMALLAAGSVVWLLYDASARTLTFRRDDPVTGESVTVLNVDGPLRIAGNAALASVELRFVHDVERLPRIAGFRPAGVWGRLATIGVMDAATGAVWDGRIEANGDPTFALSAGFAVVGNSARGGGVGDIVAINTPELPGEQRRALDDWLEWSARDEPLTILRGDFGTALSTYTQVARGVVDAISEPREGQVAISCRDPSAQLEIPWQAEVYPDTTPLASLRGRSKPTVTGAARAVPLILTDASNLLYDAADDASNAGGSIGTVYDQGVVLTSGVGYSTDLNGKSIKRLTNPAGMQCVTGGFGRLDDHAAIGATVGDFVQWSGSPSAPRGWTNLSTGIGTSVTSTASGARFVRGSSGQADLLTPNTQFPSANGFYHIDIDIAAHVSGTLTIIFETSGGTAITVATINTTGVTGVRSFWVLKSINYVRMRLRVAGASGDITIRSIRVALRSNVSAIAQHVRYAASYRGPVPASALDSSIDSFPGTMASMPLCLATAPGDRRTVRQVLDALLSSVGGAWWFGVDGKLRITALRDPADLTPVLTLDDVNIIGDVSSALDRAAGLSTRVACDPTWAVHGSADIAGSLRTTDAGRTLADALESEYAAIGTATGHVAAVYAHARDASPIPTLLGTSTGGLALANTLTALYAVQRRIYTLTVALDDALALQPGDAVTLNFAGTSRNLLVLEVRGRYSSNQLDLTAWG